MRIVKLVQLTWILEKSWSWPRWILVYIPKNSLGYDVYLVMTTSLFRRLRLRHISLGINYLALVRCKLWHSTGFLIISLIVLIGKLQMQLFLSSLICTWVAINALQLSMSRLSLNSTDTCSCGRWIMLASKMPLIDCGKLMIDLGFVSYL